MLSRQNECPVLFRDDSLFDIRGTSSDFHLRILKRLQLSPDASCEGNISVLRQHLGNWYEVKEVSLDKTEIYPERDRQSIVMHWEYIPYLPE